MVGGEDGLALGLDVGELDGALVVMGSEGLAVGVCVGGWDGSAVGWADGGCVGAAVGLAVGDAVRGGRVVSSSSSGSRLAQVRRMASTMTLPVVSLLLTETMALSRK